MARRWSVCGRRRVDEAGGWTAARSRSGLCARDGVGLSVGLPACLPACLPARLAGCLSYPLADFSRHPIAFLGSPTTDQAFS